MKKIFLLLLGSTLTLSLFGSLAFSETSQQIADQVQQAYEATQALQMNFTQETYVQLLERKVKKTGQAQFQKPGKFSIRYEGKGGREYFSDGQKLWIYKNGSRQVQVYTLKEGEIPAEALSFLGGLGKLKRDFVVEDLDEKRMAQLQISSELKGKYQWLELTPQKKQSQIDWLVMGFDPSSHLAAQLYLLTESGNLSHYVFHQVEKDPVLPEKAFVFSKPGIKEVTHR